MTEAEPTQGLERTDEEDEIVETDQLSTAYGQLYDKVYETAEKLAGTNIGQYATGKVDRLLRLIEETAKWSLPPKSESKNSSNTQLERPLPWIPFIGLIILLRIIRITLSIGGLLIGNSPLVPSDVVYFIQTRRRKLRAMRIAGMRVIREKEQARKDNQSSDIFKRLTALLSMAFCRPRQDQELSKPFTVQKNCTEEKNRPESSKSKKNFISSNCRQGEDEEDQNLSMEQILDKYVGLSSDDDSDFIPPDDILKDRDTSSSSTSSATSNDDDSDEVEFDNSNENETTQKAVKPKGDDNMTNGASKANSLMSSVKNHPTETQITNVKENGDRFSEESSVPMPKQWKDEPIPMPIQDIKQEPIDEEEGSSNTKHENLIAPNVSNEQHSSQYNQTVVEPESDLEEKMQNNIIDNDMGSFRKLNGGETLTQSGSPDLSGTFGFQPKQTLVNNFLSGERSFAFQGDKNKNTGETSAEDSTTSKSIHTSNTVKGTTNNTGKPSKNKFRGKRR